MPWQQIAGDVAVLKYPLRAFGIDFGRVVTLLRLRDGRLVIHSTAPFSTADVGAIRGFGDPAWLVEATLIHDTFGRQAQLAFPSLPYLAPADLDGIRVVPLHPPPADWTGEIDMVRISGLRRIAEHAFFHRASRTLVLADLLFHFPPEVRGWPRFFAQKIMRLPRLVGISLFFRLMIHDRQLFANSMRELMKWDFQQIVVAHGEPILQDARSTFIAALRERGLSVDG